ncbi:hypothetical protein GHT41_21455 [Citrobacter koseri]|uniref:hypothetical protein n=1 Tax=Citrobacter koseri TaxID=545 RepID=UPI0019075557|nr:hypothetical protein [Citrobacter koseri]MBJ9356245.1 hypothetical protein [Citrobacter koseri]
MAPVSASVMKSGDLPAGAGLPDASVLVCADNPWIRAGLAAVVSEVSPKALLEATVGHEPCPAGIPVVSRPEPGDDDPQALSALLFWLPELHQGLPEAVCRLAALLPLCGMGSTVLLLSRTLPPWLYRTLRNLVPDRGALPERLFLLPDHVPPQRLFLALRGGVPDEAVLLHDGSGQRNQPGLSAGELVALGASLNGVAISELSALTGSRKATLHRQRWQALQKTGGLRIKNLRHHTRHRHVMPEKD